jgi:hypothetical protein
MGSGTGLEEKDEYKTGDWESCNDQLLPPRRRGQDISLI